MPGGNLTNYKFYKFCTQQNFPIIHLKDDAWYHSICFEAFTHHSISYHKKTYPFSIQSGYDGIFIYGFFFYKCAVVPTGSYSDYSECTQIDFFILKVD